MKKASCLICNSSAVTAHKAKFAEFIAERVFDGQNKTINFLHCKDCGFAYFDYRFSDEEAQKLYSQYRKQEYLEQRQKHEPWYTEEINAIIGKNPEEIKNRKANLTSILEQFADVKNIKSVLDFGGDKGQFIPEIFSGSEKYVFDISKVEVEEGVVALESLQACREKNFDLILCAHVLEHVGDPEEIVSQMKSLLKKGQYLYIELPFDSPVEGASSGRMKNYFGLLFSKYFSPFNLFKTLLKKLKNKNFYQMHEHINYFTLQSASVLLEKQGFKVLYSGVKEIDCEWVKSEIISVLCVLEN